MQQRERPYALVVAVMVMALLIMGMIVVVMVPCMFGFFAEPAADVGGLVWGIVEAAFEKRGK